MEEGNNIKHHYKKFCFREDIVVTYILKNDRIKVTFEQACTNGFNTAIFNDKATLIDNTGFRDLDLCYFEDFVLNNIDIMYTELHSVITM